MRALVASNVLARREGTALFVPVNSTSDPVGPRVAAALASVCRFASARGVLARSSPVVAAGLQTRLMERLLPGPPVFRSALYRLTCAQRRDARAHAMAANAHAAARQRMRELIDAMA